MAEEYIPSLEIPQNQPSPTFFLIKNVALSYHVLLLIMTLHRQDQFIYFMLESESFVNLEKTLFLMPEIDKEVMFLLVIKAYMCTYP